MAENSSMVIQIGATKYVRVEDIKPVLEDARENTEELLIRDVKNYNVRHCRAYQKEIKAIDAILKEVS